MSVCMLTGHRRLPSDGGELRCRLDAYIDVLCRRGVTEFLSGGALGFDLLGAEAVLYAQCTHPQVTLTMVLPCRNQSHRYSAAQRLRYESILARAQKVDWLSDVYYDGCMLVRNRVMAERADLCLCYLTQPRGGTAHAVAAAAARGLPIFNLAEPTKE